MIKFVKIVCIGFCFGICNLRSETYNVITVSRNTGDDANYDKLAPEEIHLVFEQLATLIPTEPIKEAKGGDPFTKSPLTIVVFNEAFFGQCEPLSKEEVNVITNFYKKLPNTCLYMNFLYTDSYAEKNAEEYNLQVEISKKRYLEILTKEGDKMLKEIMQPSFIFSDRIQKCIELGHLGTKVYTEEEKNYLKSSSEKNIKFGQSLLFNQTKIFYREKEIGYYNKSSFCNEYDKFCIEKPYYVIGNFNTIYNRKEEHPLQIDCLTCYDIDVVSNECYRDRMDDQKSIFAFSSNSSSSLPCILFGIYGDLASKKILFICSDSYEDEVTAHIDCKGQDESCLKCLRGVFEYEGSILSPIEKIAEITFEYVKAKELIVQEEEEDEKSAESKDMFSLKKFNLTIK